MSLPRGSSIHSPFLPAGHAHRCIASVGRLRRASTYLLPSYISAQPSSVPSRINKPLGPDVPEQDPNMKNRRAYARDRHPLIKLHVPPYTLCTKKEVAAP